MLYYMDISKNHLSSFSFSMILILCFVNFNMVTGNAIEIFYEWQSATTQSKVAKRFNLSDLGYKTFTISIYHDLKSTNREFVFSTMKTLLDIGSTAGSIFLLQKQKGECFFVKCCSEKRVFEVNCK
jgi:hypothetical protein